MGRYEEAPLDTGAREVLDEEPRSTSIDECHSSLEDLSALETEVSFLLPADVRWAMREVPGLRIRPRVYSYQDGNRKDILPRADLLSATQSARWYGRLVAMWTEGAITDHLNDWALRLVPIAALEGGHEALCLDFRFDPIAPPVIRVDDASFAAPDSAIDFVSSSFEALLLLPVVQERDQSFLNDPADQSPLALAWTAARDKLRAER